MFVDIVVFVAPVAGVLATVIPIQAGDDQVPSLKDCIFVGRVLQEYAHAGRIGRVAEQPAN